MHTNCNIYNGSRTRINNTAHLKRIAYKLGNGTYLLAVFDNGCASFAHDSLVEMPNSFFAQEEFCARSGNRKANNQMIVFVEIENNKCMWHLLHFKNNKVITDTDIDNLIIV